MSRPFSHSLVIVTSAWVVVLTGSAGLAQSRPILAGAAGRSTIEQDPFGVLADSTVHFESLDRGFESDYTPIYLPEVDGDIGFGTATNGTLANGTQGGSAGLLQPSVDTSCLSTCGISTDGSGSSHSDESGLAGQRTTALVLGTVGAALGAMLVSRAGKSPSWHGAELLPHLAIGPTGGLYFGLHLAIRFR